VDHTADLRFPVFVQVSRLLTEAAAAFQGVPRSPMQIVVGEPASEWPRRRVGVPAIRPTWFAEVGPPPRADSEGTRVP
jgi:hypothetical protein